ncbi:hypothetical protein QBC42DRAFT_288768 [Cladorrhinum samala]|uniref:Uncharacterized protein n=1 Tax=Cladorrhinum samala TaxID=585594 RepID=A0AAV9HHY6_9PEZI|nr:hypothetical protein QBC42DRAFT_288768 [Cladorrhinum samala]
MLSTKGLAAVMLLGAVSGHNLVRDEIVNQGNGPVAELTTVGITTMTVYTTPATPASSVSTTFIFTPDPSATTASVAVVSISTASAPDTSISVNPSALAIPVTSSTVYINISVEGNNTALATDDGTPTANLTWVTEPAASTASSEQNPNASASDVRSAPPNADSKHSAAADTDLVIRCSLKAMAVGLLLALAL